MEILGKCAFFLADTAGLGKFCTGGLGCIWYRANLHTASDSPSIGFVLFLSFTHWFMIIFQQVNLLSLSK